MEPEEELEQLRHRVYELEMFGMRELSRLRELEKAND
jgi:hypothetical protein